MKIVWPKKQQKYTRQKDDKHIELHLLRCVSMNEVWTELNIQSLFRMPVCMYGSVCLYKVFVRFEFVRFCMCSRCVRFWYERGKNVCFVCDCVIVCQNPILFRFESKLSKYNGMLWLPSTHAHTANPFNHSVEMRECVLSGEIFPYAKSITLSFSSILFLLSMLPQFKSIQFNPIQIQSQSHFTSIQNFSNHYRLSSTL